MVKTKVLESPYDHKGNLMHYPGETYAGRDASGNPIYHKIDWRPNIPVLGTTLQFKHMNRGRSAAYATFTDPHDHTYPMFLSDLEELITSYVIHQGVVTADWIVKKRGQNYGIGLAKSDDIKF